MQFISENREVCVSRRIRFIRFLERSEKEIINPLASVQFRAVPWSVVPLRVFE